MLDLLHALAATEARWADGDLRDRAVAAMDRLQALAEGARDVAERLLGGLPATLAYQLVLEAWQAVRDGVLTEEEAVALGRKVYAEARARDLLRPVRGLASGERLAKRLCVDAALLLRGLLVELGLVAADVPEDDGGVPRPSGIAEVPGGPDVGGAP